MLCLVLEFTDKAKFATVVATLAKTGEITGIGRGRAGELRLNNCGKSVLDRRAWCLYRRKSEVEAFWTVWRWMGSRRRGIMGHWRCTGEVLPMHPVMPAIRLSLARSVLTAVHELNAGLKAMVINASLWPVVLELFITEARDVERRLSDLYRTPTIPKATVLRGLARRVSTGHLVRYPDPGVGHRSIVALADEACFGLGLRIERQAQILMPLGAVYGVVR